MQGNHQTDRGIKSMDKATALEHTKRYAGLVCKEIPHCRVFLFGSLANSNFNENSDIDIAVIKDDFDDRYWWELTKKLNRLTRNIDSRIGNRTVSAIKKKDPRKLDKFSGALLLFVIEVLKKLSMFYHYLLNFGHSTYPIIEM